MENNDMTTLVQVMNTLKRRGVDKEIQMNENKNLFFRILIKNTNRKILQLLKFIVSKAIQIHLIMPCFI
nr:hypothetical protein [Elizabethkingia bruuniana]